MAPWRLIAGGRPDDGASGRRLQLVADLTAAMA